MPAAFACEIFLPVNRRGNVMNMQFRLVKLGLKVKSKP
jgi:hypothetical protein